MAFYEDIFVYDTLQWEDEFNPLSPNHSHLNSSQNQHSFMKSDGDVEFELDDFNELESLKLKSLSSLTEQHQTSSPSKSSNHNLNHHSQNSSHLNHSSVSTDEDDLEDAANLHSSKNCNKITYDIFYVTLKFLQLN